ncbi:proton-conducting transporter membrane subunit [Eubacteriaceae bacterium ES3]|nr:proton-conducting transporter membrane subunit [Eubacteriaceae bacterium ES3]
MYIGIGLQADNLSSLFVLVTGLLFLVFILFSLKSSYSDKLFNFLILSVEGLINCVFLASDLFTIFISLEVSTIIVSILIMYKKDKRAIYDGMMYLLINICAMSFFLFGLGMLYKQTGYLDLGACKTQILSIDRADIFILPYAFMLTAISLKSALMPLFSWLPKAHGTPGAPAVVSALLSGLFVKSGIYLFIRLQILFNPVIQPENLFLVLGFATAMLGIIFTLKQTDIKLILAYSTVAQIGLIMIGLNFSSEQAFYGSVLHIINHAIFKAGLFLASGLIIEEYKTRDIRKISGVLSRMPGTGTALILLILGISGAPFFNGSISKYFISTGAVSPITKYGLDIINFGTIFIFVLFSKILLGKPTYTMPTKQNSLKNSLVLFLGIICLAGGIWGLDLINFLFHQNYIISVKSYTIKSITFIFSVLAGIILLNVIKPRLNSTTWDFIKKFEFDLSFNAVCLSIFLYFSALLLYLFLTV